MYGFWIKPDRYVNFQDIYAVYLNQLKCLAYRFEDVFTGKTERYIEKSGIDGYIVEASVLTEVEPYLTAYAMPKAQYVYTGTSEGGTIVTNLVPGSVLFATGTKSYGFIADDGQGALKKVDGGTVGTIDYTTGKYTFTSVVEEFSNATVGYAVKGTNVTYKDVTITGATGVKGIVGGQIPGAQVGFQGMILTVKGSRKIYVGFANSNQANLAKIVERIVAPTTSTPVDPTSVTIAPATADVTVGTSKQLTATVSPSGANQSVTWSIVATGEATGVTIDQTGNVTVESGATAEGVWTVTAKSTVKDTVSGTATITVKSA